MTPELFIVKYTTLTVGHVIVCAGILLVMKARGCRKGEQKFWTMSALGAFFRPVTLFHPFGWVMEVLGLLGFMAVLWRGSKGLRETTRTPQDVAKRDERIDALEKENGALRTALRAARQHSLPPTSIPRILAEPSARTRATLSILDHIEANRARCC